MFLVNTGTGRWDVLVNTWRGRWDVFGEHRER